MARIKKTKENTGTDVNPDAANVSADNGKGKKNGKGAKTDNGDIALDVLFKGLGVKSGEEIEILREIAKGIKTIADRVESVRRTLWRMSEIREYESKSAKGKPNKKDCGEK